MVSRLSSNAIRIGITLLLSVSVSAHSSEDQIVEANPEKAYLVFDIVVTDKDKQPTWLAVNRERRSDHIPIGRSIVELNPGRYHFKHVDFGRDHRFSRGSFPFESGFELVLQASTIMLFGRLEVSESGITLGDSTSLLKESCGIAPLVFASFPMDRRDGEPPLIYACDEQSD